MIEVCNLTKFYGPNPAIQDVSFSVEKGEILGFLGPNGAGKSTTMKILTCFMPATSGNAKVAGFDIFLNPYEIKKRIGFLPERPPLYQDMIVSSYLKYVAQIKGVLNKNISSSLERVLDKCAISNVKDRIIGRLSKGYQQRVGLAQALIHDPEILILDEPTSGLDPKQIIGIRELIKELAKEHTIILSSHILPEITMTCTRVVIINEGKVVAVDSIDSLSKSLRRTNRITLEVNFSDQRLETLLKDVKGVLSVTVSNNNSNSFTIESSLDADLREKISSQVVKSGYGLLEIKKDSVTLEDIFLNLTTEEKGI